MKKIYPKTLDELKNYILTREPALYLGSQTSTVIPFENLPEKAQEMTFCYLEKLPQKMNLTMEGFLEITGPVTWQDARIFLYEHGRDLLTTPTEELACVLSGLATSATGERCFGYGTLRNQVIEIEYMDFQGEIHQLKKDLPFMFSHEKLRKSYQDDCQKYKDFKNPPCPNFIHETDLMIGTEGQLGIITRGVIKTQKRQESLFLMLPLPPWEKDFSVHKEVYDKVQALRDDLICVEFFDHNCISFLDKEDNLSQEFDYIVLELVENKLEEIYEKLLINLKGVDSEKIVELSPAQFQKIRAKIPRAINEINTRTGIKKLGTDIQALGDEFFKLLEVYRDFSKKKVHYCLFGHFGDGHLHFNFLPETDQEEMIKKLLKTHYEKFSTWNISPFAEHGIGLIKKDFIKDYYKPIHLDFFKALKEEFDPYNQFFPLGFMNLK